MAHTKGFKVMNALYLVVLKPNNVRCVAVKNIPVAKFKHSRCVDRSLEGQNSITIIHGDHLVLV
jgi:hypothetical protein